MNKKTEYMKKWRAKNSKTWSEYMKGWREKNKEKLKKDRKIWYTKHKEQENNQARQWIKENKERWALHTRRTHANRRYPGKLTIKDVEEIVLTNKRMCYWCHKTELKGKDMTLEHLKPMNDKRFIVLACWKCNAARLHLKK